MPINKQGTPEQIKGVSVISEAQFDRVFKNIVKENMLVRCPKCSKLLSKKSEDGSKTLQHRGLKAVIKNGEITVGCVHCGVAVSFK